MPLSINSIIPKLGINVSKKLMIHKPHCNIKDKFGLFYQVFFFVSF